MSHRDQTEEKEFNRVHLSSDELISKLYLMVRDDRSLLVQGTRERMIVFAQRENGKREAFDFLQEIRTSGKRGNQVIATYQRAFELIVNTGIVKNEQIFKQLESSEGIWEIKEHHLENDAIRQAQQIRTEFVNVINRRMR